MEASPIDQLRSVCQQYISDPQNLSDLTSQLCEVFGCSQEYTEKFQRLFSLPPDADARREALAEVLTEVFVLLEDMMWHAGELHKEIDKALDEIDTDDDGQEAPLS